MTQKKPQLRVSADSLVISAREKSIVLKKIERKNSISGDTRVFGLVGDPVGHSLSPAFWNAAFAELDMNAVYIPFRVNYDNFDEAFKGLKALNVCGVNITMPHKTAAAHRCQTLHFPADRLDAVNTVSFSETSPEGWNTDATGFKRILEGLDSFSSVAVIGSGAVARSVFWAIRQFSPCRIINVRRTDSGVSENELFKSLDWNTKNIKYAVNKSDIIVNATPLGADANNSIPALIENLDSTKVFIDLNYLSRLANQANQASKMACRVIDGRELLLQQGLESFKLLTGFKAPEKTFRKIIFQ